MFQLHPRLAEDTFPIGVMELCHVLLMNDRRFPWTILVPAKTEIADLYRLAPTDRHRASDEIDRVVKALNRLYGPDKINIGILGNIVPQLHIHVVARREADDAWPGPVWGHGAAVPYDPDIAHQACRALAEELGI